jgi:hypothetical protein
MKRRRRIVIELLASLAWLAGPCVCIDTSRKAGQHLIGLIEMKSALKNGGAVKMFTEKYKNETRKCFSFRFSFFQSL